MKEKMSTTVPRHSMFRLDSTGSSVGLSGVIKRIDLINTKMGAVSRLPFRAVNPFEAVVHPRSQLWKDLILVFNTPEYIIEPWGNVMAGE